VKIFIVPLGCPKNEVEAQYLLGSLQKQGFELAENAALSDAIIIHTCSFIKSARKESEKAIRRALKIKKRTGAKIFVAGCLPQLLKEKTSELFPNIDGFVGTGSLEKLSDMIFRKEKGGFFSLAGGFTSPHRVLYSGLPSAYLKISEGCNHRCSFCIIPSLRGRQQSRQIYNICEEAKALVAAGVEEFILTAQDSTSYGQDIYGVPSLDKLLEKLADIDGVKNVKIMYAYPGSVTDRLIDVLKDYSEIFTYMDMPLQHSSLKVLAAMQRPLSGEKTAEKIKSKIPDIVLRTSFIAGFPGETEKDVLELESFIKRGFFRFAGVFEYCGQEEAPSHKLENQIPENVKKERRIFLEKAQYKVFRSQIDALKFEDTELLVEKCEEKDGYYVLTGRTLFQAPEIDGSAWARSSKPADRGKILKALIAGARGYKIQTGILHGEGNK